MMKQILLALFLAFTSCPCLLAQNDDTEETSAPSLNMEIVRKCLSLDIEGKFYYNVTAEFKSNKPDFIFNDQYKVKVTVRNNDKKIIYKKTLKGYLYIFNNGQIQVGRSKFNQIIIYTSKESNNWIGKIREKEGVY